ncbi:MAG TPA: hypothetical protein VG860_06325 [Terriglobia bacterium]|jgi:hypothetical protein|nr:hypothetical protein [Terriglobia bacterium]
MNQCVTDECVTDNYTTANRVADHCVTDHCVTESIGTFVPVLTAGCMVMTGADSRRQLGVSLA